MDLALGLGARGLGHTWPNPAVGCVIVQGGRILGRGWTQPGGRPHAETMALTQAGAGARGATAYVTLEPCAHHGKTPPCAEALVQAGLKRVVVALTDPDPRVAGRGLARLRDAGIAVETGLGAGQAAWDNRGFLLRQTEGRPFLTLKLATSLDGRIATASGESRWITAAPARRMVHLMRVRHDGVMVGAGTARADDPMLDVRDLGVASQSVRVVLSRALDLPLNGKLAQSAGAQPLWLCHGAAASVDLRAAWQGLGARLFAVPLGPDGQLDVAQALAMLAKAGLTRVFCEGGGALAAALLRARRVDQLVDFTAGLALGGDGHTGIGPLGLARLEAAPRFALHEVRRVGPDVMTIWRAAQP